ncbi:competence protein CoiA family protein [Ornithinicoccus halotolerans]|uniref:competence protein CoiA family protein n=1 Tax=Ornithinicoccus halotolerans TaxID=1748220 RepID=UPI001885EC66|nr:competence protein CoiA family protein [Ornithinicoccus halotolerans]
MITDTEPPRPRRKQLPCAVTDGPAGTAWLLMPGDHDQAVALGARHDLFRCSTAAGGCGGQLVAKPGKVNRPHFAHQAGRARQCPLTRHGVDPLDRYLHLAAQHALAAWLTTHGHPVRLEARLDNGTRADVHVTLPRAAQSLEVQLSGLPVQTWAERDSRYREEVTRTSWLFGPDTGDQLHRLHQQAYGYWLGITLAVPDPHPDADLTDPGNLPVPGDPATVTITTHLLGADPVHHPLTACHLHPDRGLLTPALADLRLRDPHDPLQLLPRPGTPQPRQHGEGPGATGGFGLPSGNRRPAPDRWPGEAPVGPDTTRPVQDTLDLTPRRPVRPRHPDAGQYTLPPAAPRRALSQHADPPPGWAPPTGWDFLTALPPELHRAGAVLAHLVCTCDAAGATAHLRFADVDDNGALARALTQAGLIEATGPDTWRRTPAATGR